jgi:hypothetical protein
MSYSTSTFSRVDKAWPAMSDTTQARIQRLREMEQIRLQKQAALFSQRDSNPIPMPKFESRITSSRPSAISDKEQNERDTFVDESSSQDTGKIDEGEITVTSEIIEILTTDIPLEEESESKHSEGNVKEDISKYQQASHDNKTEVQKTVSEPSRTLSTSYISGPLSPTSSEKTRISIVRKMKLDSLPVVKTTRASEAVTPEASNHETAVFKDSNRTTNEKDGAIVEIERTDASKLASSVDGTSIKSDTKSFLTLHEFKIQSGMNNSKSDEAVSIVDKNYKSSMKTSGDSVSEKLDNSNKPSENTETKTSTIQSSLKEEEIAIKETTVESSTISREKLSKPYTTVSTSSALSTSVQPSNPELDNTHIQELSDKDSTKSQKQSNSENTSETIISSAKSASCAKTISDTKTKSEQLTLDSNAATSETNKMPEPVLYNEDPKETVFRLGTLAQKQNLEVHAKIDKQFSSVSEDVQSRMAKLEELQRQRQERKKALEEGEEDISNLPVRERFFRNQSSGRITRPVRQQSIPEQIRASRLSRRNSDYTRSGSPGKASEAESPPLARRSRVQQRSIDRLRRRTIDTVPVLGTSSTSEVPEEKPKPKPILDIDSLDKAFGRPDQERFNRLDELDRIRIQNREKRRDSAPSVSVDVSGSMNTRADFPSSLIVNRGSCENIAQFPIHEHLESSFPMSRFSSTNTVDDITSRSRELLRSVSSDRTLSSLPSISRPSLHSSYSDSRLFPLDGGRLSQSGILSMSIDTDHSQLQQGTNQQQSAIDSDNDDTPVYMNGTPQGTPLIDNEGKTHWVGPTSPRLSTYINVIDRLENRTRNSSFDSNMPSFRHRAFDFSDSLLDAANQDHFLADCFLKKYTLKERCALIRDKIYSIKDSERGKPDGASHDSDKNKNR